MSSPGLEMSLEHQIPVLMNKTQMNSDHGGTQCGLTSLLPMSCRGRAAAFARDLHTRLRNLGNANQDDDDAESTWLARDTTTENIAVNRAASSSPRDLDTFYDFELECESPSSPVDELDAPFSEQSPTLEQPFYDLDPDSAVKEASKLKADKTKTNGFRFSTAFYSECSPVKSQPSPRENGHAEKQLYSPITFEGCARQNSNDELDCIARSSYETDRLDLPIQTNSALDSDSEFESARSDPSDILEDVLEVDKSQDIDVTDLTDALSIVENEEQCVDAVSECKDIPTIETNVFELESNENVIDKDVSPVPEIVENVISSESKTDEQDLEDDDKPQRVRRCSSLKTGKTPPGTPGRKKIVRFADVLGLDLADVKTFMDEIPVIPKSAYDDLTGCDMQNSPPVRAAPRMGALTLVPLFQVPRDLTERLEKFNVCLESARVGDGVHINVCGSVRVRNLDFHKTVHIRYTMNRWKTYTDLQAAYVAGSCDGFSDRFQFVLYAPCISSGQRLEIAIRFQCKGQQFWDNNSGANYCYDCLALGAMNNSTVASGPLHPTVDWHPSFY